MKLKELFKNRDSWTQGVLARDKHGNRVDVHSEKAVCWCLGGGMLKCYNRDALCSVVRRVQRYTGIRNIAMLNDATTFERLTRILKELDI